MRIIWVAVRGVNYTDRATREVGRNIDVLIKAQQRLRQHATQMLMAGAMWLAFAGLAVMGIGKIVGASAEGRRALRVLERATNELLTSMSQAFVRVLGPTIRLLTQFFSLVAKNQALVQLIAILATVGISLLMVAGVSMMLPAVWDMVMQKATIMGLVTVGSANTMTMAFNRLSAAMGPIMLGFMIGAQLAALFGENADKMAVVVGVLTVAVTALAIKLHSAALGLSILTFGAAAVAGIAAMAYAQKDMPSYQVGTEYVRRTRPAIVHEGEKITSARDRDLGRGEGETQRPYPIRTFTFNFTGDLHTRSDRENLKPLILKTVRDAMDNRV